MGAKRAEKSRTRRLVVRLLCLTIAAGFMAPAMRAEAVPAVKLVSDRGRVNVLYFKNGKFLGETHKVADNFTSFNNTVSFGFATSTMTAAVAGTVGGALSGIQATAQGQANPPGGPDEDSGVQAEFTADIVVNQPVFVSVRGKTADSGGPSDAFFNPWGAERNQAFEHCYLLSVGQYKIDADLSGYSYHGVPGTGSFDFDLRFDVPPAAAPRSQSSSGSVCSEPPRISAQTIAVKENQRVASISVILSHASSQTVEVGYSTRAMEAIEGGLRPDFGATSGTLSFDPGETAQTIDIEVVEDPFIEAEERFGVDLSDPQNGVLGDNGTVHILDDQCTIQAAVGASGSATAHGTPGDDVICGTYAPDHLFGDAGNDALVGGAGGDELVGDAGEDFLSGDDVVDEGATGPDCGSTVAAYRDKLFGGYGDPALIDNKKDQLVGGCGTNELNGEDGPDKLYGGPGADVLSGGRGSDLALFGGAGDDIIYGGAWNFSDSVADGDDIIFGEAGADTIFGGSGNDTIDAGADDDQTVYGGTGDDHILGGSGDDALHGERGSDWIGGGVGSDKIYGNIFDSGGADERNFLFGDYWFDLSDRVAFVQAVVSADPSPDRLFGANGNDVLVGANGDDWAEGFGGDDTLYGLRGADTFHAGLGDDFINSVDFTADTVDGGGQTTQDTCVTDPIIDAATGCEA